MRNVHLDTQIDTLENLDTQMGVHNSIWVSYGTQDTLCIKA